MAPLKIIGAGFGRTGTGSLRDALNILGFKTHHMNTFNEEGGRAEMFSEAYDNPETQDNVDWDYIYEGFDAALDWPTCSFVVPLMKKYPNAKVILTVRDTDSWYRSMENTLLREWPVHISDTPKLRMARHIILDGAQEDPAMYENAPAVKQLYDKHNEWIKKNVPKERLLVLGLGEGWEPLCQFLNVPVPNVEYPWVNTTADMHKIMEEEVQEVTVTDN